jgi:hypothetical protein
MKDTVVDLREKFSPPYHNNSSFPFHDVVINIEEVEMLKGIIGDNYRFLRNKIEEKKKLGVSFVSTKEEEKTLKNLESYLNNVVPNFLDSLERSFFIPFKQVENKIETDALSVRSGVFLCHSSKDKPIVRWFRDSFEKQGIKV